MRGRADPGRTVKAVHELPLGDSTGGIKGKIPGYTNDYRLEEFRK